MFRQVANAVENNPQGSWYNVRMTRIQEDIIIGTILGDSYICRSQSGKTSIQIKQADRYKEYVFWLHRQLKDLFLSAPRQRKDNQQWYVNSSFSGELNRVHDIFYINRKKVIPKNIKDILISPISLAVWFMDDGTLDYREKDHCAFHLCTNCFTKVEVRKLIDVLDSNFGIKSSLHYTLCRGKRHARIYIGARGRERFIELINPFVLNCFKYKLPTLYLAPQRLDPSGSDSTAVKNMVL